MGVTPPGQSKNDTDLKFGTHTPIDLIYKMPCHVDFLQISSIALYILFFWRRAGEILIMKQLGRKNNINNENYAIFS